MNTAASPFSKLAVILLACGVFAVAASAVAQVSVAVHPELGEHLVTSEGLAAYVFLPDDRGASTCVETCLENWPAIEAEEPPALGEGVQADLAGSYEREDGTLQFTYHGWPLYTFVNDEVGGPVNGQGLGGNWFVIAPDGSVLGAPETAAAEAVAMSQEEYDALYRDGIRAYRSQCAACHGRDGNEALVSHTLILENNDNLASAEHVIRQVIHGNGYMPALGGALNDRQVAAVVTYVRNSWGNDYGPVREEEIAQYR